MIVDKSPPARTTRSPRSPTRCAPVLRDADIQAEVLIRPRHFVSVHRVAAQARAGCAAQTSAVSWCSSTRTRTATASSANCTPA
ncbi:hypothetical protein ACRAWF_17750 [Streptomyces sp. L7]